MKIETNNERAARARREGLVVQELPDEVLVYDLKRHKAHYLNKSAAFIWNQCDGQRTAAEIAAQLQQETGAAVNEEVVWYALGKLGQAHLLEKRISSPIDNGLSRRRLLRQLG